MNFCTLPSLPSFPGMQSHMSGCYEHPEPSLLQLRAAVFGHPPADMCYHNTVRRKASQSKHIPGLLVLWPLIHCLEVGR